MANITDQFVTSFSELYYSTAPVNSADIDNPTTTEVRDWFGFNDTEKVIQLTVTATVAAVGGVSITLDGFTFTIDATGTADTDATSLATLINDDLLLVSVVTSGAILTVTGENRVGDFTVSDPVGLTIDDVAGNVAFVDGTHLIPLVMEIGTLSNEATVIDTPTFGDVYRGKLRGQLDGGQLDAQLYWAPRDPDHRILRGFSESGVQVYVGIKWKNTTGDTGDSEFVYFDSFVSSFGIDTTFDDVAKVSMTLVVDGAEHFASEE